LHQAALAFARLRGHPTLLREDIQAVRDRFVDAFEYLGRFEDRRQVRRMLVGTSNIRSRAHELRVAAIMQLASRPEGATLLDAWSALEMRGLFEDAADLARFLDRLAAEGHVILDARGAHHWVV
jgi:hypothetical protein